MCILCSDAGSRKVAEHQPPALLYAFLSIRYEQLRSADLESKIQAGKRLLTTLALMFTTPGLQTHSPDSSNITT
jgi:hypothetical protein